MNFKRNLVDLISDAHLYEYAGIGDTKEEISKKKPRFYFLKIQWFFVLISILITSQISKGFCENFAGYIISGLTLFVGLFFTFIITLYDKFRSIDFSIYHILQSQKKNRIGIKLKNFFKKITVLALYSVLISIVCIIFLSGVLLVPKINKEIDFYQFVTTLDQSSVWSILKFIFIITYRSTVIYFLLDFLLITLFIIASFYDFIISEYNKVKLS